MPKRIYLDYSATTPIDSMVLKAMMPYLRKEFGNPSSVHHWGQAAAAAIERARSQVAQALYCEVQQVVFTSGATEANNMVLQGVLAVFHGKNPHIITSAIEHESVLDLCREFERENLATVTYIFPDKDGIIQPEDIENAIQENTVLVSVMYANSVIGTIQPIRGIGKKIRAANEQRPLENRILFHSDGVQAVNYLDCNTQELLLDFFTVSSHKIYGPKGAGVLFVKDRETILSLLIGGGQEEGMRPGTQNVPSIVGLGAAIELARSPKLTVPNVRIRQLRDRLVRHILKTVPESTLTGSLDRRIPSNAHFQFKGIDGREAVQLLDYQGLAVSSGSACSEKTRDPDHVLLALGCSTEQANSGLRISIGKYTTKEEVERAVKIIPKVIEKLRA